MLEVDPSGQHGCMATGSGRNVNEVVVSAASEVYDNLRCEYLRVSTVKRCKAPAHSQFQQHGAV